MMRDEADYGGAFLLLAGFAVVGLVAIAGGVLWLAWYIISHLQWVPL